MGKVSGSYFFYTSRHTYALSVRNVFHFFSVDKSRTMNVVVVIKMADAKNVN